MYKFDQLKETRTERAEIIYTIILVAVAEYSDCSQ